MSLKYDALPIIYDVSAHETGWVRTLDAIVAAAGGVGALVFGTDETDAAYTVDQASSFWLGKMNLVEEFIRRFGHYDAIGRAYLTSTPPLTRFVDYDIWPGDDLFEREDYRFSREQLGIYLRAAVNLSPQHGWTAGIIVHMPETIRTVPDETWESLSFLAPHLAKSLELRRFLAKLHSRYQLALSVLDKVRIGLCLADARGEILIANAAANEILDGAAGLSLDRFNRLTSRDTDTTSALRAAILATARTARRLDGNFGASFHLVEGDVAREPLFVEVGPVRDGAGEFEADFAGALVTVVDPNAPPILPGTSLAVLCGLTDAEAEVATLLLEGHPVQRVAEMRGVSLNTVKTQQRVIYAKARVTTRGELIRKTAHLNPPIG